MSPHERRVVYELAKLTVRLDALDAFISSAMYDTLTEADMDLLALQSTYMHAYREVLKERVARFGLRSA